MATELMYHKTKPGGTCSCGYKFRLGEWISLHRAKYAELAANLYALGNDLDDLHDAVMNVKDLAE